MKLSGQNGWAVIDTLLVFGALACFAFAVDGGGAWAVAGSILIYTLAYLHVNMSKRS